MNINRFKIDNFDKISFVLFNTIVSVNEYDDFDFHIKGFNDHNNIDKLKNIIIFTYFLSPDKMYQLIFPNNILVTPAIENYGTINIETKKVTFNKFYNDKFFSFCVYKDNPKYTIGAIRNAEQYTKEYTTHKILFYVRNDVPQEIINQIQKNNGIVIKTLYLPDWFMMFTRFLPLEYSEFNSSRDTDCRLSKREIHVNNEFFKSSKQFHIIRDHPYHSTEILGGLWSTQNYNIHNLRFLILDFCLKNMNKEKVCMGHDQNFLKHYIFPIINKNEILTHDNYFNYTSNKNKITIPRINKEYLGEAFDENEQIDMSLRQVINE
jgi:hypothetical protein